MKNRIIIDFSLDEELSGKEIQILSDDIKDLIENHEFTYYATKISVKFQDEYCIKEEKKKLKKQIPKKPEYYGDGYSNGELVYDYAKCPECGNDNFEYDINNWGCKYCPDCGQALDWDETEKGGGQK